VISLAPTAEYSRRHLAFAWSLLCRIQELRRRLPTSLWCFSTKSSYFDFWAITRWQLMRAGLRPDRIEVANRCTVCESRDFFSYRGEKTTGRNAAVLAWRKNSEE